MQLLRRLATRVTARAVVHRDEAVHAAIDRFLRPFPFGDVVIHHAADGVHAIADPVGFSE